MYYEISGFIYITKDFVLDYITFNYIQYAKIIFNHLNNFSQNELNILNYTLSINFHY